MPAFFKKIIIKWSAIATLGMGAYFLGYFWGVQKFSQQIAQEMATEKAQEMAPRAPASEKPAGLGELK
jgi:hypothetical protein